jgi:zinc protease
VPANASLVVAGDFDPAAVKQWIQDLYGDLPSAEVPARPDTAAQDLPVTPLVETTDQVQLPATMLSWHTAQALSDEDAAMDLLATVLAGGRSSRLYTRLVHEEGLVTEIDAYQMSSRLGSIFQVFALANPGGDLLAVEAAVQAEIDRLAQEGPTPAELERARNQIELSMIRGLESLQDRAESLNRYQALTGSPDFLAQDLARYRLRTAADVQAAASRLSLSRRQTLRVRPEPGAEGGEQ